MEKIALKLERCCEVQCGWETFTLINVEVYVVSGNLCTAGVACVHMILIESRLGLHKSHAASRRPESINFQYVGQSAFKIYRPITEPSRRKPITANTVQPIIFLKGTIFLFLVFAWKQAITFCSSRLHSVSGIHTMRTYAISN